MNRYLAAPKFVLTIVLFIVFVMLGLFASVSVHADNREGFGYFTDQWIGSTNRAVIWNDATSSANMPYFGNSNDKAGFINWILWHRGGDGSTWQNRNQVGAHYIIQTMRGSTDFGYSDAGDVADWQARINSPSVVLSTEIVDDTLTSGYQNVGGQDDDTRYNRGSSTGELGLVFRENGVAVYRIRYSCANPVGYPPGLSGAADTQPISTVNGSAGTTTYINPTQTAAFNAYNSVTNYKGTNHAITARVERQLDSGAWTNIHQGSYLATGNGNTMIWGTYNIGPGTTIGGNLLAGGGGALATNGPIPATAQQICHRMRLTNAGGANVVGSNPSTPACAKVRYGQTTADSTTPNEFIEPGESTSIQGLIRTTNFRWPGEPGAAYPAGCTYTIVTTPGPGAGNNGTIGGGALSGSCDQTISSNNLLTPVSRTYTTDPNTRVGTRICITINVSVDPSFGGNTSSQACINVVGKPYFKAFAGDVAVGCSTTANGQISSWNKGAASGFSGAGTAFAAFALGDITDFSSAQGGTGPGIAAPAKGLTFATGTSTYGGNYGKTTCVADYYGARPTVSGTNVLVKSIADGNFNATDYAAANTDGAATPGAKQAYNASMNVVVNGGTLNRGTSVTLYVDGDVYIDGNIIMQDAVDLSATPTFAAVNVPIMRFVVCGNVSIAPGVSRLDAIIIAQQKTDCGGSATKGEIYTCGTSTYTAYFVNAANFTTCNTQLTVNGSLVAHKIYFTRTFGTLSRHANGDFSRGGSGAANTGELIQYNPLNWIQLEADGVNTGSNSRYDSISTLPPVL